MVDIHQNAEHFLVRTCDIPDEGATEGGEATRHRRWWKGYAGNVDKLGTKNALDEVCFVWDAQCEIRGFYCGSLRGCNSVKSRCVGNFLERKPHSKGTGLSFDMNLERQSYPTEPKLKGNELVWVQHGARQGSVSLEQTKESTNDSLITNKQHS